jgi:hypothetical protein
MSTELNVGDKVVFQDAYTDETRYGVIAQMSGGDAIIRSITKEEAGGSPKPLPKMQIACAFARDGHGTPICSYHRKQLTQLSVQGHQPNPPGIGHFSAWICPISSSQILDAGFNQ